MRPSVDRTRTADDSCGTTLRYRQILAIFEDREHGLRAQDFFEALGTGTEHRHFEGGVRVKLKRVVDPGIPYRL
ncbi:hypothetical protein N7925_03415 [Streptomyces sp. CA-278952]|uniref:hypothetical protein n=1 Tax=unclassified Streptomyces TaxID=2593676 RepID=UPI002367B460|nr:hypothetical protein [Streptomyces sp. CA-278952]WDG27448.1 hypothetical protein N7925_03415 [Streptomyces sp. CA-278952]